MTIACSFLETCAASAQDRLLGRVLYGAQAGAPELIDGAPTLRIPMACSDDAGFAEIWRSGQPPQSGSCGDLVYAHDDQFLFCAGHIPASGQYADATRAAYLRMFELINRLGFPSIFRIWNFIGGINADNDEGLEIYRDFCRGRSDAFAQGYAGVQRMPAATGIGMQGGGVAFHLLACRSACPLHIENPRQLPAYHYPRQYGPRAPSFARASLLPEAAPDAGPGMLFISGTASILGHETVHRGDIDGQCAVAIDNLAHLVSAENLARHGVRAGYALRDLDHIKLYYRHRHHLPALRAACARAFHPDAQIRYLEADICRADLLVEIEAVIQAART
jgi:FkbO/Hyg5 family chorismatase